MIEQLGSFIVIVATIMFLFLKPTDDLWKLLVSAIYCVIEVSTGDLMLSIALTIGFSMVPKDGVTRLIFLVTSLAGVYLIEASSVLAAWICLSIMTSALIFISSSTGTLAQRSAAMYILIPGMLASILLGTAAWLELGSSYSKGIGALWLLGIILKFGIFPLTPWKWWALHGVGRETLLVLWLNELCIILYFIAHPTYMPSTGWILVSSLGILLSLYFLMNSRS